MLSLFSLIVLAQSALPDPKSAEAVGWLVLTAAAAAAAINQGASFWQKVNPKPSPPNHEVFATKSELKKEKDGIDAALLKLEKDHEDEMKRIEGRFETWLEQNETHHREELKVLTEWKDNMGKWQVDIAGAMGKLHAMFERSMKR